MIQLLIRMLVGLMIVFTLGTVQALTEIKEGVEMPLLQEIDDISPIGLREDDGFEGAMLEPFVPDAIEKKIILKKKRKRALALKKKRDKVKARKFAKGKKGKKGKFVSKKRRSLKGRKLAKGKRIKAGTKKRKISSVKKRKNKKQSKKKRSKKKRRKKKAFKSKK